MGEEHISRGLLGREPKEESRKNATGGACWESGWIEPRDPHATQARYH